MTAILWPALLALLLPAQEPTVRSLAFMSGCWERRTASGTVEEQWMAPRGGTMLGMSRTVRGQATVGYEYLRIQAHDGALLYHAAPSGQAPATFRAAHVAGQTVAFENPEHDFPQRIIYRAAPGDSLHARIEGTVNGQARSADFRYGRVACPES